MSKISSSPERNTFQKEGAIQRAEEKGELPNQAYIDMWDQIKIDDANKIHDPAWQKNNMEYDLRSSEELCNKVKATDTYAQNLYAAMCNNDFQKLDVVPILKEETWSASWRHSGGIIADMREKGDYIDWYCSGIGDGLGNGDPEHTKGYVPEGMITDEIRNDLQRLGWVIAPGGDWEKFT
jgi:hypothetical protein